MKLRFRLLCIMAAALFRQRDFEHGDTSSLQFILMPWDCGITRASNDRYLAFMDLGRIDIAIRLGWWKIMVKKRACPFVITVHIRYSSSLKIFQRFVLHTRIIYWDRQYIWMEHIFEQNGKMVATAISKNLARITNGVKRPGAIFQLFPNELESPMKNEQVILFDAVDQFLRNI